MSTRQITATPRLEKFFARMIPQRARLIFALDATASRQPTWDLASKLQANMFAAANGLDVQLVYYRGVDGFVASRWLTDAPSLADIMCRVTCRSGPTQIQRVLQHAGKENQRERVNALVMVSDACEELLERLYDAARALRDVPAFMFQERSDPGVTEIYAELAKITGGALARFDAGAASRLADLLGAVAAFATGGVAALEAQKTEAATLLLTQVKR